MRPLLALALAAAILIGGAHPAAALAVVPFAADSGDSCQRGRTQGSLEWVEGPVVRPTVKVAGTLTDDGPASTCAPDGMHSRVSFIAFNGSAIVDSEQAKADDASVAFTLILQDQNGVRAIDRVVVQICRYSNSPIGISYCGPAKEYRTP
ncbi:hypothetical protein [Nonomuraea typhae]|uniref:Uncharacterized protein n=1 Tax=Nonomuraea typhae TaxID=2603600 RepID=A0ABW7Z531_9ACTN